MKEKQTAGALTRSTEFCKKKKTKTFVYSDTGKDIVQRFKEETCTVKVIKEIADPLKDVAWDGWKPKDKKKYV